MITIPKYRAKRVDTRGYVDPWVTGTPFFQEAAEVWMMLHFLYAIPENRPTSKTTRPLITFTRIDPETIEEAKNET